MEIINQYFNGNHQSIFQWKSSINISMEIINQCYKESILYSGIKAWTHKRRMRERAKSVLMVDKKHVILA
jgi:hypothetical protein